MAWVSPEVQGGQNGHPGCHHFGVTPFYEVKPHLHWFAVIFFPSSFRPKTNQFSVEDLFLSFCFGLHIFLGRKPTNLTAMTCFCLVFTYFWTEKEWHHKIPPRVPPSLATPLVSVKSFVSYDQNFAVLVKNLWRHTNRSGYARTQWFIKNIGISLTT